VFWPTAFDTQRIKNDYLTFAYAEGTDEAGKRSVLDALALYLNFVNLFQLQLSFMGQRQDTAFRGVDGKPRELCPRAFSCALDGRRGAA